MLASRAVALASVNPVSALNDQELRVAIAREVFGWLNIRAELNGRIRADHPTILTTVPLFVPDWPNSESRLRHLESVIRQMGLSEAYRRELSGLAGAFNPKPTPRQRCEAALMAVRNPDDTI
jgi:hypothetical protein